MFSRGESAILKIKRHTATELIMDERLASISIGVIEII